MLTVPLVKPIAPLSQSHTARFGEFLVGVASSTMLQLLKHAPAQCLACEPPSSDNINVRQ